MIYINILNILIREEKEVGQPLNMAPDVNILGVHSKCVPSNHAVNVLDQDYKDRKGNSKVIFYMTHLLNKIFTH